MNNQQKSVQTPRL